MKNLTKVFSVLTVGMAVSVAGASTTPGAGSITGHSITKINTQVQNSNGAANPTNSVYYFVATSGNSPADTTDSFGGTNVVAASTYFGSGSASDSIPAQISPVLGGHPYNVYAKACPPLAQ